MKDARSGEHVRHRCQHRRAATRMSVEIDHPAYDCLYLALAVELQQTNAFRETCISADNPKGRAGFPRGVLRGAWMNCLRFTKASGIALTLRDYESCCCLKVVTSCRRSHGETGFDLLSPMRLTTNRGGSRRVI